MINNMNSGYNGYSMSNRAVAAYESGENPLSKWTKKDLLSHMNIMVNNYLLIIIRFL